MVRNGLLTSYYTLELYCFEFEDGTLCNVIDEASIVFDNEIHKYVDVDDFHHPSRSETDSENWSKKPRSSNFQSFNKLPELFDLPDTGTLLIVQHHPLTIEIFSAL